MLQNGEIILRRFDDKDANALATLLNNKKVWDNLRDYIPFPYSIHDAVAFIEQTKKEEPQMSFAIQFHQDFCGAIGLIAQKDVYRQTAEIGYWLGEPFWNRGIISTAIGLVTDYAFNKLHFIRLHTGVFSYNTASMRALEKNGYEKDGLFKNAVIKNGVMLDEHRFSKTT